MIYFLSLILALLPTYLIRFHIFGLPARYANQLAGVAGWPTTLLEILIVVFLFICLVKFKTWDWKKIKNLGWLNWIAGLFVLAGIISTLVSPDLIKTLGQLKAFIIEPILFGYACLLVIQSEKDLKIALRGLWAAASLISLFGIIQYFTFFNLPLRFWGTGVELERITSVFDYPNALSLYLAPLLGFFVILSWKKFSLMKREKLYWFGLGLMCAALILTFSRGAWLAVLITLLLLAWRHFNFKKTILALVIITAILFLVPPVRERLTLGIKDPSSSAHWDLMRVGINKIMIDPFVGNGLGGFPNTLKQTNFPGEILNYPHNIFLNFWLELGLLGLISFAGVCVLVFEQAKKRPTTLTLAAGVFLMILILHGLVDAPYFKNDLAVLFWFIVSLSYLPKLSQST